MSHPNQNPWADQPSENQHYQAPQAQAHAQHDYQPPGHPPPGQQQQYPPQDQQYQPTYQQQQQPHYPQDHQYNQPPNLPPRQTDSDSAFLPQGQERSEQIETLQSYEMSKPESEEDRIQEQLQKEFPNIDSSLIAAIYGDSKNLGQTREMLHELSSAQ